MIAEHGGELGIRSIEGLYGAVGNVKATYAGEYLLSFPYEMAAAYLVYITNGHPFVDGNKRTAFAVALEFLLVHGLILNVSNDEGHALATRVATGETNRTKVSEFLSEHCVSAESAAGD